ncbi:CDGSH iron-sulfur domain-containing protein [Thermomicrobiaceae bacterium CFH 74404]|uniref:CDGSH iron-sulfur domain-containing protein n=3 Tax=Thermomicrobia TaxID=189775 RepID=A0AA41WEQ2_9BACT|nr:CDGSH iron-sulfur domain-containing protein [Thermalbibacter longus]MCM8749214.1 CDGSH iron-sulfur domain-containing protein [Thermalbibacter longus]
MAEVQITVTRNGPYHVKGPVKLVDHRGNEIPYEGDEVWLCRCGGSQTKPFCDGTHRKIGFQGAIAVPVKAAGESS